MLTLNVSEMGEWNEDGRTVYITNDIDRHETIMGSLRALLHTMREVWVLYPVTPKVIKKMNRNISGSGG